MEGKMITGVKHVSIAVQDYDRAIDFYTKKLGFKVLVDALCPQMGRWVELKIPNGETQLVLFTPEGQENQIGTFTNIVLTTMDVEKTHKELSSKGVEFTVPPTTESWGTYCILKDSEGNTFCLSSS